MHPFVLDCLAGTCKLTPSPNLTNNVSFDRLCRDVHSGHKVTAVSTPTARLSKEKDTGRPFRGAARDCGLREVA